MHIYITLMCACYSTFSIQQYFREHLPYREYFEIVVHMYVRMTA